MAAVLFVVYIPNEDGESSDTQDDDEKDTAPTVKFSSGDVGPTDAKVGDTDTDDADEGGGVLECLIESCKSSGGGSDAMANDLKKSQSFSLNNAVASALPPLRLNSGERDRRASAAGLSIAIADNKLTSAESKQSVVLKGDKVRFQVTTLPRDDLHASKSAMSAGSKSTPESGVGSWPSSQIQDETMPDMVMERLTLKEAIHDILDALKIYNDVWKLTDNGNFWHLQFIVYSDKSEQVMKRLVGFGCGRIPETSLSVFSSNIHYNQDDSPKLPNKQTSEKSEFMKSIKSRLTVAQVVIAVQSNAVLTFDFLVLIALASIIAGIGLAESSSVVLVASMLISPLMGPIVGFTFGVVIENTALYKVSVRNELIGLSVCLVLGFLFGLITGGINNPGAYWGSSDSWPTQEMQARGMLRSLWVGVLIALPSGAGVALSILGGNTGSLVGVAISASLLPPAVNAGMLWGLALISAGSHPSTDTFSFTADNSGQLNCSSLVNNNYKFVYSCHMSIEAAILGCVSLLLTILNIICIFVAGIVVLKIKEIAPHTAINQQTEAFWKKDIPVMRDAYKTVKGSAITDYRIMIKQLLTDANVQSSDPSEETVKNICEMVENDPVYMDIASQLHNPTTNHLMKQLSSECSSPTPKHIQSTIVDDHYLTVTTSDTQRQLLERCNSMLISPATPQSTTTTSVTATPQSDGPSVLRIRSRNASRSSDDLMLIDMNLIAAHQKQAHKRRSGRHTYIASPSVKHEAPLIEISEPNDSKAQ